MENENELVIDVKINADEVAGKLSRATEAVIRLKDEQSGLQKQQTSLARENAALTKEISLRGDATGELTARINANSGKMEENAKKIAATSAQIEANNRVVKSNTAMLQLSTLANIDENATLDQQRQLLNAAQKAYSSMTAEQKEAAGGAEYLEQQIKDLNDRVVEAEGNLGDHRRNVGNYTESIVEAADQMGGFGANITNIINPMKSATAVMKAMAATPLLAALSIIVAVLVKLAERFKSNQAAMEKLTPLFGAFAGVSNMVNVVIDKIAEGLGWIAEKALQLAEKLGILNDHIKDGIKISNEELDIQREQQKVALANAESQNKIAKLKAAATETDKYTAKQRLEMYQQAADEEEAIAQRQYELAKREYELELLKGKQSNNAVADDGAELAAKAKMIQAETDLFAKRQELNGQMAGLRTQLATEQKAARDQNLKLMDEEMAKLDEMREEIRRRSQTDLQNSIEDLEKQRDEELKIKGLTAEEKLAIEKYYEEEISKLRNAEAEERKKKEEEERKEAQQKANEIAQKYQEETLAEQYANELKQLKDFYDQGLLMTEQYEQAKAQIEAQYRTAKAEADLNSAQEYLNSVSSLNSAISSVQDAAMQRYEQTQEREKKALEARLKSGTISEEKYNKEVAKMDEEAEQKKIALERQQAVREKAMGIMSATISTAQAIIKALADPGGFAGIALSAIAGATGAAQIASIAAQPLPQFSTGGVVPGTSYTGDKVIARLNSGEGVLTQSGLNNAGNMLRAVDSGAIGVDYEMMAQAVAAQPAPVVVYEEMEQFGQKVATFNEIAKV